MYQCPQHSHPLLAFHGRAYAEMLLIRGAKVQINGRRTE